MKKLVLILFVLFIGVSSSFAYSDYAYVELEPNLPSTHHVDVPLFSNYDIHYYSAMEVADPSCGFYGWIYLRHDDYLSEISINHYGFKYKDSDEITLSGYWTVLTMEAHGYNCYGHGVLEW